MAFDHTSPWGEILVFLEQHGTALLHASELLGGEDAARRTARLLRDAVAALPGRRIMLELFALRDLLALENVDDPDAPESGFFAAIDPADPVVEEICLLTDQLTDLLSDMEEGGQPASWAA